MISQKLSPKKTASSHDSSASVVKTNNIYIRPPILCKANKKSSTSPKPTNKVFPQKSQQLLNGYIRSFTQKIGIQASQLLKHQQDKTRDKEQEEGELQKYNKEQVSIGQEQDSLRENDVGIKKQARLEEIRLENQIKQLFCANARQISQFVLLNGLQLPETMIELLSGVNLRVLMRDDKKE